MPSATGAGSMPAAARQLMNTPRLNTIAHPRRQTGIYPQAMAFLKSLIDRLFPGRESGGSHMPEDQYERLDYLRHHHEWIDVTVCKSGRSYQSLILAIDPDHKEMVIDELYPNRNGEHLESGDRLEVNCRSKHAPVNFFTRLLARETRDGETAYRLELPEEIGIRHSRETYRVYVENEPGLDIDIRIEDQTVPAVRIINLSTDGIKLSFPQDAAPLLDQTHQLTDCLIRLPTDMYVDCEIELRNVYPIRSPFPHILAGGKMTVPHPQQRVKLQQYLASVQRKQRRRENRE